MRYLLLLYCLFALACSRETWHAPLVLPDDSTGKPIVPPAGKYVFRGHVVITQQLGDNNVATSTTTGKTKGEAVAIGPNASATATKAPLPWWVFALIGVLSIAGWEWLKKWLPWRVKPG